MSKRITDPAALLALQKKAKEDLELRGGEKDLRITVHMGTCGIAAGARDILSQLVTELGKISGHKVMLRQSGCAGLCDQEPMLTLGDKSGNEYRYGKLDQAKVREIIEGHVLGGKPVARLLINR